MRLKRSVGAFSLNDLPNGWAELISRLAPVLAFVVGSLLLALLGTRAWSTAAAGWTAQTSGTTSALYGVSFVDELTATAAGPVPTLVVRADREEVGGVAAPTLVIPSINTISVTSPPTGRRRIISSTFTELTAT